jgi:outer membrane protein assembly factor BamB
LNLTETGLSFGWSVSLGDIDGSPVLQSGRLYVGTNQGLAYALDPNDGRVLWSFATGEPIQGFIFPDHASDRIYFSTTTKVWGLTFGSSEPNWPPVTLAGPSTAAFLSGMKLVLVGAGDGKLYQLDISNAGPGVPPQIRSVVLGDGLAAVGTPLIDVQNLLVHVGSESGFIYAVKIPLLE